MEKKKKQKRSKKKTVIIIIACILLFFAVQGPLVWASQTGKFAAGNRDEYSVANTAALPENELTGKCILFLGSSVTAGSAANGESFVDFMEKRDGIIPIKEAVGGTVLVDEKVWGKKSYIERMMSMDPTVKADAFVCQLSTNDATMKKTLGSVSDSFNREDFDTHTVAGAIEYVIAYARETWNCPIIFYTGTKYDSEHYGKMVELLLEIQRKWDIGVLDLWNDPDMNAVSEADYKLYMVNGIHPSRAGYREWWVPKFEAFLKDYFD